MKIRLVLSLVLTAWAQPTLAQDHLIPDVSVFVDPDAYLLKVRHIFAPAFEHNVRLRVLMLPSFDKECVAGLRDQDDGVEAFVLRPSSIVADFQTLEDIENGNLPSFDANGKEIPFKDDPDYQALKKRTPADYRDIKPVLKSRPIPKDVASELSSLWKKTLLNAKYPKKPEDGCDGVTYEFSGPLGLDGPGHEISAHIWSPGEGTPMGKFVALAEGLADYADGKADLDRLKALLGKVSPPE